jgi:hypothetical protein
MTEKRILRIPEIPRGSRLERYVNVIEEIVKTDPSARARLNDFFLSLFNECSSYVRNFPLEGAVWPLNIVLLRCSTTEKFLEELESLDNEAIECESPKHPDNLLAVCVGNEILARIFIDCELLTETLRYNAVTFVYTVVETYFHEILHGVFQERKSEQEIWDIQFSLIENFLGFTIPQERKKLKAEDYYSPR